MNFCPNCQQVFEPTVTACPVDGTKLLPQLTEIPSDPRLITGRILENKYVIERLLGTGGMAFVMKARHIFLGREVAIKILKPEILTIPELRKRFLREAKSASETKHPGIVDVIDFGITPGGIYYLVMEMLEGENLFQYMKRHPNLQETEVAHIAVEMLDALGAVHARGIIHRDVKPDNFVIQSANGGDLKVKLVDFGLAKVFDDSDQDQATERLTHCSVVMGSPHHMSPEQARGLNLDARSDIYSVGCILYEICTGRLPFEGRNSVEVMSKQLVDEPVPPATYRDDLSEGLESVILGCLSKDPANRYRSTGALTEAILDLYPDARTPGWTPNRMHNWTQEIAIPAQAPTLRDTTLDVTIGATRDTPLDTPQIVEILEVDRVDIEPALPAPKTRSNKRWLWAGLAATLVVAGAVSGGVYIMRADQTVHQPAKAASAPVSAAKAEPAKTQPAPEPPESAKPPAELARPVDITQQSPGSVALSSKSVGRADADQPTVVATPVVAKPETSRATSASTGPAKRKAPKKPLEKVVEAQPAEKFDKQEPVKRPMPKGFKDPFEGRGGN